MIETILLFQEEKTPTSLEHQIKSLCPNLDITDKTNSVLSFQKLVFSKRPDLLFIDLNVSGTENAREFLNLFPLDCEIIFVSTNKDFVMGAIQLCAAGYILKPVQKEDLLIAVENAEKRIRLKEENKNNKLLINKMLNKISGNELIGVPTISGFDFLPAEDIIRCEGLQKCTRIFTKIRPKITSSYNLGEFRKLLEPYGFFSPHKSHLINLHYIKQYKKEGSIVMTDDTIIPISRRKKSEFLDCMTCVKMTDRSGF